jgi:branched-subunit amino acid transport protein
MRPEPLSSLEIIFLILGMAIITGLTRSFFVFLGDRVKVPELVLRSIRYAPLAAIVGILVPELVLPPGALEISQLDWKLPNIWGGMAAFGVYFWTRQMLPTLLVGMAVFSLVRHWI